MDFRLLYSVPADYAERWTKWTRSFRGHGSAKRVRRLLFADRAFVALYVIAYLALGWSLVCTNVAAAIGYVASTALCFVLFSCFRAWRNAPRPYEKFELKPLGRASGKGMTTGKSFPSRHVFCAFLIATMVSLAFFPYGCIALLLAAALAWMRVLEGVHFPRDVAAAALLGALAGALCMQVVLSCCDSRAALLGMT